MSRSDDLYWTRPNNDLCNVQPLPSRQLGRLLGFCSPSYFEAIEIHSSSHISTRLVAAINGHLLKVAI